MSRARRLGAVAFIAALALRSSATPAEPIAAGDPLFRDVTRRSGIDFESGFLDVEGFAFVGLMARSSAAAGDYDGDGDVDLFIVRGDIGPHLLYRNDGRLRFTEVAAAAGLAYTRASGLNYRHAGATFADLDGDGHLDLFLGGLHGDPSLLFRNNGDGTFDDVTARSGLDTMNAEQTFSAAFGDYDLDGDLDMALAHWGTWRGAGVAYGPAVRRDPDQPPDTEHLWRNDSSAERIRFTSVSVAAGISPPSSTPVMAPSPIAPGPSVWTTPSSAVPRCVPTSTTTATSCCCTKVRHSGKTSRVARTSCGVQLRGLPPNTEAVGARITVTTTGAGDTRVRMRELSLGSNYLSQNPLVQVFGLGGQTECDVEVEWPDGRRTRLAQVAVGETLLVTHPALP